MSIEDLEALKKKLQKEAAQKAAAEKKPSAGSNASTKQRAPQPPPPGAPTRPRPQAPSKGAAPSRTPGERDARQDLDAWERAMAGVRRVGEDRRQAPRRNPQVVEQRRQVQAAEERAALTELEALVRGKGPLPDPAFEGPFEGQSPNCSRKEFALLKDGGYPVQAEFDLHGYTRDDARLAVEMFLSNSRERGLKTVLIIFGRGTNSPQGTSVLKSIVAATLTSGGFARHVRAFCPALPRHGGVGAVYVLLGKG